MTRPVDERAKDEVVRLHDALSSWVRGEMPETDFEAEIADALSPGFHIVEPDGTLRSREDIVAALRNGRGNNPGFRIRIEVVEVVATDRTFCVVTYVERQSGARLAPTPENARRSTLVLEFGDRLRHRFLQETRLTG